MQEVAMDKECHHKSPDLALGEIIQTEDKILLGKHRVPLPSPEASPYRNEYEVRVGSQRVIGRSFLGSYLTPALKRRAKKYSASWILLLNRRWQIPAVRSSLPANASAIT